MSEGSKHDLTKTFTRGVITLGGVFVMLFAAEFAIELYRHGMPSMRELSWAGRNNAKLVDSLSPIARAYNNVLAMLLATVGLAIPLTANMHTPKLIDLFLKDRINRGVLTLMALGAANVLFVIYMIGPDFAPMWAYRFAVAGALVGWVVLIPYYFYVVRFLDPSTIVELIRREALAIITQAADKKCAAEKAQEEMRERLSQLGTLVMKSIDRGDREIAREGLWALKTIVESYRHRKDDMPEDWFAVGREDFVGMSHYALEMMSQKRTWIETQVLYQLMLCYHHALSRAPDTVSAITNVNRKIAIDAIERDDRHVVSQCIRLFNTFLREALNRGETRAAFDIFYQYRQLASDMRDDEDFVRRIGGFFVTYGELARQLDQHFVWQLSAFELQRGVEKAFKVDNGCADELLDVLLEMTNERNGELDPSRVRAKLIAAGFFADRGMKDHVDRIRVHLDRLPRAVVRAAAEHLVSIEKREFWEITDRAVNVEWTKPERRREIAKLAEEYAD